ncbi:MAG: response regulator transcription factor [Deltaproteobacteria bacterium]|nr:response regulator transcription factor [Deltaproteobacteria bacterium]
METCILIVEDEKDLLEILEYNLKKEGYFVKSSLNGQGGLAALDTTPIPELVILDLMLPDISGIEICRRLRANPKTRDIPVLMLTAKSEEIDRVIGFEVGADDYVTKPFSVRELMLRVKALLKRSATRETPGEEIVFGALKIDVPAHRVWVNEEETVLTALEFNLLTTLYERKGRVQTREVLLCDVWDINADVTTRTVDTHVKRLREKIGLAGVYIETVRGVGYRFAGRINEGGV